jgi:hypothetical protein
MTARKKGMQCDVTAGRIDLSKYEKVDGVWKELGLAAPARRALVNNKILKISDFRKFTIDEVAEFHGMGPNALTLLKKAKAPFKK